MSQTKTAEALWAESLKIWVEDGDPNEEVLASMSSQTQVIKMMRSISPPTAISAARGGAAYVVGMVSAVIAKTMYDLATEIDALDIPAKEKCERLEYATTLATGVMIGADSAQRMISGEDPIGDGSMAKSWQDAVSTAHATREAADDRS